MAPCERTISVAAKVDYSRLIASINKAREVPKNYGPDVTNKTALKVAIGSKGSPGLVQLTERASKTKITADLKQNKLGIKIVMVWLKKQGIKRTRQAISEGYKKIVAFRFRSIGSIVSGWLHSAGKLAAKVPGSKLTRLNPKSVERFEQGDAAKSYEKLATSGSLSAGLFNTSDGADIICDHALLQQAVNAALADNLVYLKRKFGAGVADAVMGGNRAANVTDTESPLAIHN